MEAVNHPLTKMIQLYCSQYSALRDDNLDLSNLAFHKKYSLQIHVPENWDILNCLKFWLEHTCNKIGPNVVIMFSSTKFYHKIYNVLGDKPEYISWHEVYTGMHTVQNDIRYIQRVKNLLYDADMVFFIDAPAIPEIIDQVCGQTSGGLVILF